jgi:hypothetical protein
MAASGKVIRGFLLGLVLLALPLAWACGSDSTADTADESATKEIVDTATKLAEKQQRPSAGVDHGAWRPSPHRRPTAARRPWPIASRRQKRPPPAVTSNGASPLT